MSLANSVALPWPVARLRCTLEERVQAWRRRRKRNHKKEQAGLRGWGGGIDSGHMAPRLRRAYLEIVRRA